jgi:hypothetical protein
MLKHEVMRELDEEEEEEDEAEEPRRLNMEEKRKLEKLLLTDIDFAVGRYEKQAEVMRRSLIKKLETNPPAEVKKLFESYVLKKKEQAKLKSKLDELGYDINYDGTLDVNIAGKMPTELAAFDKLESGMHQSLQSLKRNYVIKLFADHADTQSLFASLAEDLKRLIG